MLVTFVLGSIHAFSIFIHSLETLLGESRGNISLVYSMALVCLTLFVLFGYRFYRLSSPASIVIASCGGAAIGMLITALAQQLWQVFVGYSLIFGAANGLGYGFVLQLVAREMPDHKGFAMGAVTAAYAIGATVFARVLSEFITPQSSAGAFLFMACSLLLAGSVAGTVLWFTRTRYHDLSGNVTNFKADSHHVSLYWIAYGLSVFAGLMAIGHAAGIVQSGHSNQMNNSSLAIWGAVLIGAGNAIGGFAAGYLCDRIPVRKLLTGLPLVSAICLFALALSDHASLSAAVLSLVGLTYGAIIAVYPYAINLQFGDHDGPRVYGLVFTAWGFAGLVGPWLAGTLYDNSGSYSVPLAVAGIAALLSATTVIFSIIASEPV